MNRGSIVEQHRHVWIEIRFNEAPIHESGKYPPDAPPRSRRPGFNEAPIHESGKCLKRTGAQPPPSGLQ